jgi:hypothetical protein
MGVEFFRDACAGTTTFLLPFTTLLVDRKPQEVIRVVSIAIVPIISQYVILTNSQIHNQSRIIRFVVSAVPH